MGAGGPGNQTRCDGRAPLWNRTLAVQPVTSKVYSQQKGQDVEWGASAYLGDEAREGQTNSESYLGVMRRVTGRIALCCADDQRTPRFTESASWTLLLPFSPLKGNLSAQHLQTPAQNKSRSNVFCVAGKHLRRKQPFYYELGWSLHSRADSAPQRSASSSLWAISRRCQQPALQAQCVGWPDD